MQFLSSEATSSHPYLLDAAHNPSGLLRILPELEQYILQYAPKHNSLPVWSLVFGTSPQDDLGQFLEPLLDFCHRFPPKQIVLTRPQGGRYPGVSVDALIQQNWQRNDVQHYPLPVDAINALASCESKNVGLVVSLGSLYLQGNLLSAFGWSTDEHLSLYAKD
jgi:folylpolyglutamate synthase/dihydropteroate synthase